MEVLRVTSGLLSELLLAVLMLAGEGAVEPIVVEGFTEPYRTIEVAAAEPGIVATLHVREGDTVQKGQILATLDIDVLEAAREVARLSKEAQGRIQTAAAQLRYKRDRLARLQELEAEGHAFAEEVRVAENEVEIAEADLLAAQEDQQIKAQEYARIQAQIDRRQVRSPIQGVVTQIHKEESEYVAATDPHVVTVVQCDRLRAFFPVPASWAFRLTSGQKVRLQFAESFPPAYGTIEFVSPVIDPESGNVQVKVLIDNARGTYRSGLACSLELPPDPSAALAEGERKSSR